MVCFFFIAVVYGKYALFNHHSCIQTAPVPVSWSASSPVIQPSNVCQSVEVEYCPPVTSSIYASIAYRNLHDNYNINNFTKVEKAGKKIQTKTIYLAFNKLGRKRPTDETPACLHTVEWWRGWDGRTAKCDCFIMTPPSMGAIVVNILCNHNDKLRASE